MAYLTVKKYSEALERETEFEMFIPDTDKPLRTLFLLHGYHGRAENWVPEETAAQFGFAVVMPNGENSFWLDGAATGRKYCTYVGRELPEYLHRVFGLAGSPEDTCIMGLSMGGFGAIHTALAYPETFGAAAGLSSALIVRGIAGMKPGDDRGPANYDYYRECFGDLDKVVESDSNPETLVKRIKESGGRMPELYMSCGTEDDLLETNREFHKFLDSEGVRHSYFESRGGHDITFWKEYAVIFSELMFGGK